MLVFCMVLLQGLQGVVEGGCKGFHGRAGGEGGWRGRKQVMGCIEWHWKWSNASETVPGLTLRGWRVVEVCREEGVMGCTFKKAPMAPRKPSCLRNSAAISPCSIVQQALEYKLQK